jgi:hypothetical protein
MVIWRPAVFFIISIVTAFGACSVPPASKSRFLSSFSARDVIEKSYDLPKGDGEFRVSGGETSSVLGSRRIYHRDDTADLRISQSEERSFLQRIKGQIELQLQGAGCKIADAGSGESNYSIAYTDEKVHGWIDVWGMRGPGDRYRLVITITEH